MTKEQLLQPRFKVIADYPSSVGAVGEIIDECTEEMTAFFTKYPHLFKRLKWHHDRQSEDMPEYIKRSEGNYVVKVKLWQDNNQFFIDSEGHGNETFLFTPATHQDYNNYLESKK